VVVEDIDVIIGLPENPAVSLVQDYHRGGLGILLHAGQGALLGRNGGPLVCRISSVGGGEDCPARGEEDNNEAQTGRQGSASAGSIVHGGFLQWGAIQNSELLVLYPQRIGCQSGL